MQHLGNGGTVRELLAAALVTLSASEVKSEQVKGEKNSWGNNSWYGNGGGGGDHDNWKKGEKTEAAKQDDAEGEWMKGEKLQDEAEGRELAEEAESGIDSP